MTHRRTYLGLLGITLITAMTGALWAAPAAPPPPLDKGPGPKAGPAEPRGRDRPSFNITDEQEAELLKVLKEQQPAEYEQLISLKSENARRYKFVLSERWRWYQRWKTLPEAVQKSMANQFDARVQVGRIRAALTQNPDDATKAKLTIELKVQIARLFDSNQTIRKHYLAELQERLARFSDEIKSRGENRDRLIAEQVEGILANPAGADDEETGPGPGPRPDRP